MPDSDGWEIQAWHRPLIWHADCDRHVPNAPEAKARHLKACRAEGAKVAREAEKVRRDAATARIREINRLRRKARKSV